MTTPVDSGAAWPSGMCEPHGLYMCSHCATKAADLSPDAVKAMADALKVVAPDTSAMLIALRRVLTAAEKDAARWQYARTRIMWDRHGPCLACGLTKVDAAETDKNIDAAMAKEPT